MSEPTSPGASPGGVMPTFVRLERTDPSGPLIPAGGGAPATMPAGAPVVATSASSRAAIQLAAASSGRALTIPWPTVPSASDSDPRRRIPVLAIITGLIGELLITAGVLLGLYVVWELVWSTVEARPLQRQALEVVHKRPGYVPPAPDTAAWAPEYTDNIPEVAVPDRGEPWVSLHVPRWGYKYNIVIAEGVDKYSILDQGLIGHYPDTQGPGELGNFAVAGHRITHGEPFAGIQALRDADELIVETDENYLVFAVYDRDIVSPYDMSVIYPVPGQEGVDPVKRLITLTTCHPRYTSTSRYIVWGDFQYWTKKSEGRLKALVPPSKR